MQRWRGDELCRDVELSDSRPVFGRMQQPIPECEPYEWECALLDALGLTESGLPVELYRSGAPHVFVELESEDEVAALKPDFAALEGLGIAANCHPSWACMSSTSGVPDGDAVHRSVCILRAMSDRPNAHDALLGATSELTYEYGITGTGVDAIAARAGVTKRTLYQHFGSKDRLVAEALNDRNRRALLSLETNARRRSEETGELVILALFDVIENALRTRTKAGCAFINASLEINRPGHPVREAALAHLRAREGLVRQLLTEAGVEDADLAAQVTLLVDGAYAVGGSRRDPAAARPAKAAVAALLAGRVVS
jgi:AcrR family transcriptional regulator